jgi:hypothetical protein
MRAPIAILLILAACRAEDLPQESSLPHLTAGKLAASADARGVLLENRGSEPLRVAVVDSLFFEHGLASWCMGQDECGVALAPGAELLVPADEVTGPPPRQKAVSVFWWDVRPDLTPDQKTARFNRIHLRLP